MIMKFYPILWIVLVQFSTQILSAQDNSDSISQSLIEQSLQIENQQESLFYYSFEHKIPLNPVENKYTVEFIDSADESIFDLHNFNHLKISQKIYEVEGNREDIKNAGQGIYNLNQLFTIDDGLMMHMKNSIILKWNEDVNDDLRTFLISLYGLTETKATRLYNVYRVVNPLHISQNIYETGMVRYCHPVFLAEAEIHEYIPNDEYFGKQFYLHNTGQECNDGHFGTADADIDASEAWGITIGSSDIVIAIVDQGVTSDHPDLPNLRQKRLQGSNFAAQYNPSGGDPNDPSPLGIGDNHGNACAGIVAAEMDNNEGIVGIAPNCRVMPVKIPLINGYYVGVTPSVYASAITFAADSGAHIISNSWGYNSTNSNLYPEIVIAIEDAIAQGAIVLFSAGNTAHHALEYNGFVKFPGNVNIEQLITVGASDRNDKQANYSPTNTKINICAPSHTAFSNKIIGEGKNVWTIDIPGNVGYNPDPDPEVDEELPSLGINHLAYTGRMGGTSASTPMVAGVVALMLSVNPDLSVDQVLDVLYSTAEEVGGYDYTWNSDLPGHSKELGYGRVNAFLALQGALQTPILSAGNDTLVCENDEEFFLNAQNINENDTFYWEYPDGTSAPLNENITVPQIASSSGVYTLYYYNDAFPTPYSDQMTLTVLNTDLSLVQDGMCIGNESIVSTELVGDFTYSWSSDWSEFVDPGDTSSYHFEATEPFDIILTANTDQCPFDIIDTLTVEIIEEYFEWSLGEDISVCLGESVDLGIPPQDGYYYFWISSTPEMPTPAASELTYTPTVSNEVFLHVIGQECITIMSDTILINVVDETVFVDIGEDQTLCYGESISFEVDLSEDDYDFAWANHTGQIFSTTNSLTTTPFFTTMFTLTLSTDNCASVAVGNDSAIITLEEYTCNCGDYYHHDNYSVDTDTTWGDYLPTTTATEAPPGVLRIENTLTIQSGVTLTLDPDVTLEFGAYGRITVEQGAELIVNGATITKACDEYWYGIEVLGNDDSPQTSYYQGTVDLNEEARIEYAKTGVSLIGHTQDFDIVWGTAGGIITTDEATFYNCRRAIEFMKYQNVSSGGNLANNVSYLKNAQFIVDDGLNEVFDGGSLKQISMWGVQGVRLRNCDFENQISSTNTDEFNKFEGIGLLSINASFKLLANPTTFTFPTSESQYDRSSVSGFFAGVAVNNSDELSALRINRTDFSNNYIGAYINNSLFSTLTRNTFGVTENETWAGSEGYASSFGLALDHSTFYTVEENVFTGDENPTTNTSGLSIFNSGYLDNEIYRNEFNDLVYGTMVYGNNGFNASIFNTDFNLGLSLKCNDYGLKTTSSDNTTDIYLHTDAVIDAIQGSPGTTQSPAGNRFSDNPENLLDGNISIRNPEFNIEAYFHHIEQFTRPDYSDALKVNKVALDIEFGDDRNVPCPSNLTFGIIRHKAENKEFIVQKRLYLELLEDQYKNILNGGIKPEIMELLVDDFASSSAIRQKLIMGSPYLSDDVLIAAITRQIPLNQWHLTEVLVWNSPLTKTVKQVFYQAQPLTPYLASLVLNKDGNSQRLLLELAQKAISEEIVSLEKEYLFTAFNDENIENPYALAYNLYQDQNTPEALRIKIAALLHQKDYQTAQSLVYEYAQVYTDNFADFKQIELELKQAGLNWFQMSDTQLETLQQIASQKEVYGANNAQVILDLVNDTQLTEYLLPIAAPLEMRQALSYDYTTVNRNLLSLSPNPTNGEVYASYELPENYQQAQLEIYNALGQKVDVLDVSSNKYLSRINCEQYTSGIYLVTLLVDGMKIESQTLSVITK